MKRAQKVGMGLETIYKCYDSCVSEHNTTKNSRLASVHVAAFLKIPPESVSRSGGCSQTQESGAANAATQEEIFFFIFLFSSTRTGVCKRRYVALFFILFPVNLPAVRSVRKISIFLKYKNMPAVTNAPKFLFLKKLIS